MRLQKELCLAKETHSSKNNITNEFSNNAVLNKLNLAILLLTKQLKTGESYDLDIDNQFIACEKYDAKKISFIENTFMLKKFIFRFVVIPYKWIKKGGQKNFKLFTDKPYNLVLV